MKSRIGIVLVVSLLCAYVIAEFVRGAPRAANNDQLTLQQRAAVSKVLSKYRKAAGKWPKRRSEVESRLDEDCRRKVWTIRLERIGKVQSIDSEIAHYALRSIDGKVTKISALEINGSMN